MADKALGRRSLIDTDKQIINPATSDKQDDIITGLDNVEIEKNRGTLSINNSTTTSLGAGETFTGIADDIKDYTAINIAIWADKASATDGLSIEWSQEGTNWDEKMTVSIGASKTESYEFGVRARYFRLVYTNGAVAQTAFRLQVIFHPVRTREGARCLCVDIDPREFAKTVRAVLAAKKPDGTYKNIHATTGGNLKVAVEETIGLESPVSTALTLTTANTAYLMPASELSDRSLLIIYNKSDTVIYIGSSSVTTSNGIPVAVGKTLEIESKNDLYAVCGVSGKSINLLELK